MSARSVVSATSNHQAPVWFSNRFFLSQFQSIKQPYPHVPIDRFLPCMVYMGTISLHRFTVPDLIEIPNSIPVLVV